MRKQKVKVETPIDAQILGQKEDHLGLTNWVAIATIVNVIVSLTIAGLQCNTSRQVHDLYRGTYRPWMGATFREVTISQMHTIGVIITLENVGNVPASNVMGKFPVFINGKLESPQSKSKDPLPAVIMQGKSVPQTFTIQEPFFSRIITGLDTLEIHIILDYDGLDGAHHQTILKGEFDRTSGNFTYRGGTAN